MPGLEDAAEELHKIFTDTANSALGAGYGLLTDRAEWIKTDLPNTATSAAKWIHEANRRGCRQAARTPRGAMNSYNRAVFDSTCNAYLDSIGEKPLAGSSSPELPGQCVGVPYKVTIYTQSYNSDGTSNPSTASTYTGFLGPLSITRAANYVVYGERHENITDIKSANHPTGNYITVEGLVTFPISGGWVIRTYAIARTDGGADCITPGNYNPGANKPGLQPIPPPENNAPNTNDKNWDVKINPDGSISICVNGVCSDGRSGGGGAPDEKGKPDGPPIPTDPEGNAEGKCEDGYLVGIKITILPPIPKNYRSFGPDIYRAVAWIWMGPSSDQLDLVPDGANLRDGQFVIPDTEHATAWKVKANVGWKLSIQQFCRKKRKDEE